MLKSTLVIILILASVGFCEEITFTAEPMIIDDSISDGHWGNFLPNASCQAITEFKGGPNQGKLMFIDITDLSQPEGYWSYKPTFGDVGFAILSIDNGVDSWEQEFVGLTESGFLPGLNGLLVHDGNVSGNAYYSQMPNASIFSDSSGTIHMSTWQIQKVHNYSRYQPSGSGLTYEWFGDGGDIPFFSPFFLWKFVGQQRFGQVLQPTFFLNEASISFPPLVKPTFFVNGHDTEDTYIRAGFYLWELTDLSDTGVWGDPVVVSPQDFGNMGYGSVAGDDTGTLNLFWGSQVNSGVFNQGYHSTWKSCPSRQELYHTKFSNGQPSNISQLTDLVESSEDGLYGVNIISSAVAPDGNLWVVYEVVIDFSGNDWVDACRLDIIKLSPTGSILYGPATLLENQGWNVKYTSPQLQIDNEGIAHLAYIVREGDWWGSTSMKYYYGNFDSSDSTPQLENITTVSGENYRAGVGHMFVDSQRRIHFTWTSPRPVGLEEYSTICYRRSESYATSMRDLAESSPTSLAEIEDQNVFHGVYPNPAHDVVNITFSIVEPQKIRICVYDIAGRLVSVLFDELISAGKHSLEWNLDSEQGSVSDGLHLIKFESASLDTVERVVITR